MTRTAQEPSLWGRPPQMTADRESALAVVRGQ
jgi:hypothetical protein